MKVATYNVWNEPAHFHLRRPELLETICALDADVIGMQEVPSDFYHEHLAALPQYPYTIFGQYAGEDEGLAILSQYPIQASCFLHEADARSQALHALLKVEERHISFTTLHLPWDSALEKERQICAIDRFLHSMLEQAELFILAGDFNGGLNTSVHRYLTGSQSLNGQEANPYWDELATGWEALSGERVQPTLDLLHNPRWRGKRCAYPPTVMDRIYTLENGCELSLAAHGIFGTKVSDKHGWAPSDHWGVAAQLEIK